MAKTAAVTAIAPVSNDAEEIIDITQPYRALVKVAGTSPLLLHAWSVEGVREKSAAAKGSKAKKEDNLETFVYRNETGELCSPGEYFRMSTINAAKFRQDPRSPRKSAMDLFKAGIVSLEPLCTLGVSAWDYVDQRRVMVQRNGITRMRPAMNTGWKAEVLFQVMLPEYIGSAFLNDTIQAAGKLVGVGDFRPTYGRFQVTEFKILED